MITVESAGTSIYLALTLLWLYYATCWSTLSTTAGRNLSGSTGLEPASHLQLSQKVWKSNRTGICMSSCTSIPGHLSVIQGVGEFTKSLLSLQNPQFYSNLTLNLTSQNCPLGVGTPFLSTHWWLLWSAPSLTWADRISRASRYR